MREGGEPPPANASAGGHLNPQYDAFPLEQASPETLQSAHHTRHFVEVPPTPNVGLMETGIVGVSDLEGHKTIEGRK